MIQQVTFDITTLADGSYSSALLPLTAQGARTGEHAKGPFLLYAVEWIVNELDAGVDAVLSMTDTVGGTDKTLLTLTNADANAWYYPRAVAHSVAGAALASGADVTASYAKQIVEGTLKLVVSNGGNVQRGTCIVYLLEA
jgi:hypothetical protein